MSKFDAVFNGNIEVDFSEMQPVPEGKGYLLLIEDVQPHISARGNMTARVTFMVEKPPTEQHAEGKGRALTEFYPVAGRGSSRLAMLMKAVGLDVLAGKMAFNPLDLVDKSLVADIEHHVFEGEPRARVMRPRPVSTPTNSLPL